MTARAARIERIGELLEVRRHPERRIGIFSATNLTRIGLRLAAMGAAAAVVRALLGDGALALVMAGIAVAIADEGVTRLWRGIRHGVQRGWRVVGAAASFLVVVVMVGVAASPSVADAARGWWEGFAEDRRAALDDQARARRVPVTADAAVAERWRVLLEDGAVLMGTHAEAEAACTALGPEWTLPPGLGVWPEMDRYPDLGATVYVWTLGGSGLHVGDGRAPGGGVSGSGRAGEVHGILCFRADA